jgi:hypothetical protein
MTTKTRYFVIASLLVLGIGVGIGLVAYTVGFPTSAFSSQGGPDELRYVPGDASVVAFANVQDVMNSDLRRRLKAVMPTSEDGHQEFESRTGINIETDIDRVVAVIGASSGPDRPQSAMAIATGRFDAVKVESLMREHGAVVEEYKGKRLLVSTEASRRLLEKDPAPAPESTEPRADRTFALAFLQPGVIAAGSSALVHRAVDLETGGDNITTNEEVMELVRSLDTGNNAWALGHFEALQPRTKLPENVASQIPAINLFSVSAHINGGVQGTVRAEARDDEAANNLRDVVRGLLALGKLQTGGKPEVQAMMDSLQLGGTGRTVALTFAVPSEIFEMIDRTQPERLEGNQNQ